MKETERKIKEIIDKLRPFLINDGGNIEFIKYENNIVYIKMMGACANCQMLDLTLRDGIAAAIINEIPEVIDVVNLN
ncbi:MAG: NifU family protein [Bacilli bacterium]|nr:NifU family protein [Bacilli bacterium]